MNHDVVLEREETSRSSEHNGPESIESGRFFKHGDVEAACEAACKTIAPAWPLDRSIAVNPYWERINQPVRQVAARMAVLGGISLFPPRTQICAAWESGRITENDLEYALASVAEANNAGLTKDKCINELSNAQTIPRLPLLIDVLDDDPRRHERLSWRQAITHQVSQTCASYFDKFQADWQPHRRTGLYGFWRDTLMHDHGIATLMGLPSFAKSLEALPETRQEAEAWLLQRLGLPEEVWPDYLQALLLTVNGWASWCAYLRWEANLQHQTDEHLRDLLAIRLAWGVILLGCKDDEASHQAFAAVQRDWRNAEGFFKSAEASLLVDEIWQAAYEVGYQRQLAGKLGVVAQMSKLNVAMDVDVQAAFCIDVRSEPIRRALESVSPTIETIGFAGFFGLPIAYTPMGTEARRPQLPGLLAPSLEVTETAKSVVTTTGPTDKAIDRIVRDSRLTQFALADQALSVTRWPGASFSFVEAAGIAYLGKLSRWLRPPRQTRARDDLSGISKRYQNVCRPSFVDLDDSAKAELASRVLHAMGIAHRLAQLVVLVGHGSQTTNNAHAAKLDCGACCGQTGEINVRLLAQLMNDLAVRACLKEKSIDVPEGTEFVAALHNTTTDEIEAFDLDLLSQEARDRWNKVYKAFDQACDQVRRERALSLDLDPRMDHNKLLASFRERANDGAQTRPEWGLAGNAAFIIAPRHRSRGAMLGGRCFLHEYDSAQDADGSVLEQLMTAPMLVTHWINWQYHASTSDPVHMGSGNKILHNVVGGNVGVFEGNGGDLRIGLAKQSLHDGQSWVHEPLRLTVVIDASCEAIERVIDRHPTVRDLIVNNWLHLWHMGDVQLRRYVDGGWQPVAS